MRHLIYRFLPAAALVCIFIALINFISVGTVNADSCISTSTIVVRFTQYRFKLDGTDADGVMTANPYNQYFHATAADGLQYYTNAWYYVSIPANTYYKFTTVSNATKWIFTNTTSSGTGQYCDYNPSATATPTKTNTLTPSPTGPTSTITLSPTATLSPTPTPSNQYFLSHAFIISDATRDYTSATTIDGSFMPPACPVGSIWRGVYSISKSTITSTDDNNSTELSRFLDAQYSYTAVDYYSRVGRGGTNGWSQSVGVEYTKTMAVFNVPTETNPGLCQTNSEYPIDCTYKNEHAPAERSSMTFKDYILRAAGTIEQDIWSVCYGVPPEEEPNTDNILCDGDMEEYYRSPGCWHETDSGSVYRPDGSYGGSLPYTWDRINTYLAPFPLNFSNWLSFGDARCGSGYQAVSKVAQIGTNLYYGPKGAGSAIGQDFIWDGGTLNWRLSARGKFQRLSPPSPPGKAIVYIYGGNPEQRYDLLFEQNLTLAWQTFTGSVDDLPLGPYTIILDAWDKERFLSTTIDDGVVYYDDVYVSYSSISSTACEMEIQSTPTPQLTWTPLATRTNTPRFGVVPPTPDGSPTPTPNPELLNIWNCGFVAGSNLWHFNSESYIALAGGPSDPQHAVAKGIYPNVYQIVTTYKSDQIYISAYVKGSARIRMVNIDSGQSIEFYSSLGYLWSWTLIQRNMFLPAGRYRLELNAYSDNGTEAFYDGITASWYGFANIDQSWCAATPTPGPTAFLTATPTPTASSGPSKTPTITWTPIPSITAYRTWTSEPLQATQTVIAGSTATSALLTATAQGTPAPNLTGTASSGQLSTIQAQLTGIAAQLTSTALGTPQSWAGTGTPGIPGGGGYGTPGPQQPPGGQGGLCIRPVDWDALNVTKWLDYEICEVKVFLSWGDGNTAQINGFYRTLQVKEPFGTARELNEVILVSQQLFNTYDFSGSGGIKGSNNLPSKDMFTRPGNLWNSERFSLIGEGPQYSTSCNLTVQEAIGYNLGRPVCFVFDVLYKNNLTPWFQFFINWGSIGAAWIYLRKMINNL